MANKTYGRYPFGLSDIKISTIDGTVEDLNAAQTATLTLNSTNAILRGDDVDKASKTFLSGGEIEFQAGGWSSGAMSIMLGITPTVSSSTPTETTEIQIDAGQSMPYFKMFAKILGDGSDDLHIKCSYVKLTEGFSMGFSDGEFSAPTFKANIFDNGTNGLVEILQNETGTALPTS